MNLHTLEKKLFEFFYGIFFFVFCGFFHSFVKPPHRTSPQPSNDDVAKKGRRTKFPFLCFFLDFFHVSGQKRKTEIELNFLGSRFHFPRSFFSLAGGKRNCRNHFGHFQTHERFPQPSPRFVCPLGK